MLRVVSELRPAYVLAENVRGACNLALDTVQSGMEAEGYEVRTLLLPAAAFGAPHKRERMFVIGIRKDVAYAFAERLQRGERGCSFLEQGAPALEPASERCEGSLWPTPSVHGNYNRRGLSENSGDGLATAVRMWATPSSADCKGSHGGGQGRSLRTDIHEIKKMWPTPQARAYRSGDKLGGVRDQRKDDTGWSRNLNDVASPGGQLSPAWVEILMGFPLGWTDPDCDEPEPWPGWPAMMGERQYPYEPPRTGTGIPHRAARLKALGNSVVPAQAYPFFEAIAIMEEVRTQCNTASST
jgi:DNA (cytosine-5)-methyltransferase 1